MTLSILFSIAISPLFLIVSLFSDGEDGGSDFFTDPLYSDCPGNVFHDQSGEDF